jgi:hypothetical protein
VTGWRAPPPLHVIAAGALHSAHVIRPNNWRLTCSQGQEDERRDDKQRYPMHGGQVKRPAVAALSATDGPVESEGHLRHG